MPYGKEVDDLLDSLGGHVSRTALSSGVFGGQANTVLMVGSEAMIQALARSNPRPINPDPDNPDKLIQNKDGSFPHMPGYDGPYST